MQRETLDFVWELWTMNFTLSQPGTQTSQIISTFGSRILMIYSLDLLFSTAHILRTLFNIRAGEGSYLDGA